MAGEKKSTHTNAGRGDNDVDSLFQLPLAEFTAARNALATRLKKAGDAEEAARVKALQKPSVAAWAANQLYWHNRVLFDRLLESGERFRKAQTAQLAGKSADLRAPLETRRTTLSELSSRAAKMLTQAGSATTPDTMRRITTTLEALSTYAGLPDAPQPGRLTDDVQPPGFEALAALVPQIGRGGHAAGPPRVIPFQNKARPKSNARKSAGEQDEQARAAERTARRAAAKAALQEAERTLRDARKTAQRAEEELKTAAARAKEADAEKAKAEKQFEQAAAAADAARKNARAVAAEAEEAAQGVADAERALEKARGALSSMNDD